MSTSLRSLKRRNLKSLRRRLGHIRAAWEKNPANPNGILVLTAKQLADEVRGAFLSLGPAMREAWKRGERLPEPKWEPPPPLPPSFFKHMKG